MRKSQIEDQNQQNKTQKSSNSEIDSLYRQDIKDSKRQTKLQKFLRTIDQQFQQEMCLYLQKQRNGFQKNQLLPNIHKITIYEDILFIYTFKMEEANLCNQNKKKTVDKLLDMLVTLTRKQKVTIKERIQKKLSGLKIQQLKKNMKMGWDNTFDKKNINSKKDEGKNHSPHISLQKYLDSKRKSNIFKIIQDDQEEINTTAKERDKQGTKTIFHQKENSLNNQIVFQHLQPQEYLYKNTNGLYRYGSRLIKNNIYVSYSKASNEFVVFNKQSYNKFVLQTQNIRSGQNIFKAGQRKEQKKQFNQQVLIKQNHRSPQIKNDQSKEKKSQDIFSEHELTPLKSDPSQSQISNYITSIEDERHKTIAVIQDLSYQQKTKSNISQIGNFENQRTQNNCFQSHPKLQKPAYPQLSRTVQYNDGIKNRPAAQNKLNRSNCSSSKSSITSNRQKDIFNKPNTPEQQLFYDLNNSILYLNLIKQEPHKQKKYLWSKQEDEILRKFHRDPTSSQSDMKCLLRYKDGPYILERYQFLQIELSSIIINQLQILQKKKDKETGPLKQLDALKIL